MFVPNLLVTDDDAAFRDVVCESLSRRGFHVTAACDGQEAIELLGQSEVHFALVDVHMPGLGGLDVIRHLDRQPNSPPCVLMSAQMDDATRREAIAMHAYDVLDKPIRMNRLTKMVYDALIEVYGWKPA